MAEAENIKPERFVWFWLDGCTCQNTRRPAASRLVHQEYLVSLTEEYRLESFAPVRRRLPCGSALPGSMEEHESVRPRILRRLIKHIGMIDMLCLSGRIKRMRSVIRPLRLQRLSAGRETSLRGQYDRFFLIHQESSLSRHFSLLYTGKEKAYMNPGIALTDGILFTAARTSGIPSLSSGISS